MKIRVCEEVVGERASLITVSDFNKTVCYYTRLQYRGRIIAFYDHTGEELVLDTNYWRRFEGSKPHLQKFITTYTDRPPTWRLEEENVSNFNFANLN